MFISLAIDASERRYVIVCDIPGAFMQAWIDEVVHVKFEGKIAQLLLKVNPSLYKKYRVYHDHKPVIYVKLNKALYGTLQAAMLFWRELSTFIVDTLGFTLNPVDNCVANKTINGAQCTILWHVDDLKISHVDPTVVESILERLNDRFGQQKPLSVARGPVLDYLGMRLDFSTAGQVSVTMPEFMDQLLDDLPADMNGTNTTPAPEYLFDVDPSAPKLPPNEKDRFHTLVAKLLYLSKHRHPCGFPHYSC